MPFKIDAFSTLTAIVMSPMSFKRIIKAMTNPNAVYRKEFISLSIGMGRLFIVDDSCFSR